MTTYKITNANSKKHIGKIINVENGKTIFNKKPYNFNTIIFDDPNITPLYYLTLVSDRITRDIHIEITEIK